MYEYIRIYYIHANLKTHFKTCGHIDSNLGNLGTSITKIIKNIFILHILVHHT